MTLLPEPDSPTIASVSPAATSNDTSSTAVTVPALGAEARGQVADLEQRRAATSAVRPVQLLSNPIFFFSSWSTQMRA